MLEVVKGNPLFFNICFSYYIALEVFIKPASKKESNNEIVDIFCFKIENAS